MATNYGNPHQPKIVRFAGGKERSTITLPMVDGESFYMGSFVKRISGTAAAPDASEFGAAEFIDDARVLGFVVDMYRENSSVPLWDDDNAAGSVTNATGELPVKYTADASNDESNTTLGENELLEIMPIMPGDILEVSLWGGSTVSVDRGTTTSWGTTDSTANIHVGLGIDTTYTFALTESGADADLDDQDFLTTRIRNKYPRRAHRVYVTPLRHDSAITIVE